LIIDPQIVLDLDPTLKDWQNEVNENGDMFIPSIPHSNFIRQEL